MDAKSPRMDGMRLTKVSQWVRSLKLRTSVTVLMLAASLMALTLIVHNQYGPRVFGGWLQSASDKLLQAYEGAVRVGFGSLRVAAPEGLSQAYENTARTDFESLQATPDGLSQAGSSAPPDQEADGLPTAEEVRYRALAGYLAKRYRVSQDITFDLVSHAHDVGRQIGLDPLLIIAVIAIESRFNPIAESVAGAKGLMQVIPKYHIAKLEEFGGEKAVYDPATNIVIGARILKEYIRYTGSLGAALQMYAGALSDSEDQYTNKVMSEKLRLQHALARALQRPTATKTAFAHQLQSTALD